MFVPLYSLNHIYIFKFYSITVWYNFTMKLKDFLDFLTIVLYYFGCDQNGYNEKKKQGMGKWFNL